MSEAGGRGGQTPGDDREDAADRRTHDPGPSEAGGRGGQTPDGGTFVDEAHRYELGSRIATGGMGEVWRGTDTVLNRAVAIKLLKSEYADDPTFRSRFETEARHAASLHHPGVAAVYDFGEAGATGSEVHRPYLVMELVDGQPLSALLAGGRPLDPDVVRDLMAQAADAIGAAHAAGIIHRDVKPANLLVTPDGTVKITDFGIARAAEGMALTETGQVMGTPQYLSPEQAQGTTASPASDVYSLGVVAFECLAGRRPFVAETAVATALAHLREPVPDLPPEIPHDLAAVVKRAMSKSPDERFPDGTAFAAALRDPSSVPPLGATVVAAAPATDATQVLAGAAPVGAAGTATPTSTPAPTPAASQASDSSGRRVPWAWILLAALVVAGIIAIAVLAGGDDDDPTTPEPTRQSTPREPSGPESTPTEEEPTEEPSEEPPPSPTEEEPTQPTQEPSESPEPTEPPTETEPTEEESPTPTESEPPADETSPSAAPDEESGEQPTAPVATASRSQVSEDDA